MLPFSLLRGFAGSRWLALALAILAGRAIAQEPHGIPAFGWDALRTSELVVAARYKSHEGSKLSLEVLEVLRGKTCKAGDILTVQLAQTMTVRSEREYRQKTPGAGPQIAYVWQEGVALRSIPAVLDAAQPLVYFFPKEKTPLLDRPGQIQPDRRDGWQQALAGKPMSLAFRLTFDRQSALYKEALAELYKTRDAAAIVSLVDAVGSPSPIAARHHDPATAERILQTLGDRGGDLYEPTLKAIRAIKIQGGSEEWKVTRLARILARADSKRAHGDLAALLKKGSQSLQSALVQALPDLESEDGLDLIFEHIRGSAVPDATLNALMGVMFPNRDDKRLASIRMAKIQDLAVARIRKMLKNREIGGDAYQQAMFNGNFLLLVERPKGFFHNPQGNPLLPLEGGPLLKTLPAQDPFPQQQVSDNVQRALKNDIVSGRKLLKEALAGKEPLPVAEKEQLAWLAVLYGDPDWGPVKQPAERVIGFRNPQATYAYQRETLSVFLKNLDALPSYFGSHQPMNAAYTARLLALYPNHLDEYFKRVAALITSEHLSQREFGLYCLESCFAWRFDLDAADPIPALVRKLDEVRPLFARMSRGSLLEARGVLLGHFGVKLDGPPSKGWLPTLEKAACSWNPTICLNALRVLSMLVGDPDKMRHWNAPLSTRAEELKSHLATGYIYRHPTLGLERKPLLPDRLQTLWQNLTSDDQATGSQAMQELLAAPKSSLAFLRKTLTVPPAPDAKRCAALIADLGSPTFKVRDRANAELKKLGEGGVPHLRRELDKQVPLEVRRRVEELLKLSAAGRVGVVRALQVLENLPGNAAWDFLEELAAGPADASLTREARGSVRRVKQYWQW